LEGFIFYQTPSTKMDYTTLLNNLQSVQYCIGKIISFSSSEQRQNYFNHHPNPDSRIICPTKKSIQSLNKTKWNANDGLSIWPVWSYAGRLSETTDAHYLAIVFMKFRKEIWLYNPQLRENRCIRSWPPQMKIAVSWYGKQWKLFAVYGSQDGTPDCGDKVVEFIKTFQTKFDELNQEKQSIISIK
jgi:hypothetical protein